MPDAKSFIDQYRNQKVSDKLRYEETTVSYTVAGMPLVQCRDAKLLGGRYPNMKLSDIYIFNPNYLTYLLRNDNVDAELKKIVQEVIQNQSWGSDATSREIAL